MSAARSRSATSATSPVNVTLGPSPSRAASRSSRARSGPSPTTPAVKGTPAAASVASASRNRAGPLLAMSRPTNTIAGGPSALAVAGGWKRSWSTPLGMTSIRAASTPRSPRWAATDEDTAMTRSLRRRMNRPTDRSWAAAGRRVRTGSDPNEPRWAVRTSGTPSPGCSRAAASDVWNIRWLAWRTWGRRSAAARAATRRAAGAHATWAPTSRARSKEGTGTTRRPATSGAGSRVPVVTTTISAPRPARRR